MACLAALLAIRAQGAILLTNGSFETVGSLYSPALGGIYAASAWTNLSGLTIQASSVPGAAEGTPPTTTGSRILRLVNDEGSSNPANVGRIAQKLGTMVTGETYTFNADAFGGLPIGVNWGATAKFVDQGVASPPSTYAAQTVNGVGAGVLISNAFNLSYTARPVDDGKPLWIWLEAVAVGAGQASRGGIDNARVTVSTSSSAKELLDFSLGAMGTGKIDGTNISVTVPYGTIVTNLAPTYTASTSASGRPASGTPLDFTSPKVYVITAQDGSTRSYMATVAVAPPSPARDILTFSFPSLGSCAIVGTNILKAVPGGTSLSNLAPVFTVSPFASASPPSGTPRNFNTPQLYTVTAQDGSTRTYQASILFLSTNLTIVNNGTSLSVDNGLVRLDLGRTNAGYTKKFSALNASAQWEEVCSSFIPDFTANPSGNPLFNGSATPRRYRVHEMATNSFAVHSPSPSSVVVEITGSSLGAQFTERIYLETGRKFFHVANTIVLPTNALDYCMSSFTFNFAGIPEFVHSPTAKKEEFRWSPATPISGQVVGDVAFHSPALILQQGGLFAAMVPDLDSINRDKVLSPDARRTRYVGATIYDSPEVTGNYSMPTALDLNINSGLTRQPVMSYGMMDYIVGHEIRHYRLNDASMIRTLATNTISYGFDLFLGAQEPSNRGYQQISRYLWERYGQPLLRSRPHLALPSEEYVKLVYGIVSQPMSPSVQAPVPGYADHGVFLDFTMSNQPVCSMVAPLGVLGFGDALWNFEFWNPVRDASGMYYWGQKLGKPDLRDRARGIINLALLAPRETNGMFCLTYLAQSGTWLRGCVSAPARSLFSKNNDTWDVPAMSKTAAHLVEYYKQCEQDPRILAWLAPYANWLATSINPDGRIPSYFTPAMLPNDPFTVNAQSAASMWFLSEFYSITNNPSYLAGSIRIASYLISNVIPNQRWMDLEPWFSDGQNPLDLTVDPVQGLPLKGNLSTIWAAEGFASLYRNTGSDLYLRTGEQVVDYLAFWQNGWNFHYIYAAFPFGGVTSDNVDTAACLDARQAETVRSFFWYGQQLGRQDLLERAVAAARSGAVLINHPLHIANGIYSHPNIYGTGLGPENINHGGFNQSAMRTHPSWGECSAIFTGLGTADYLMSGCYVNATNLLAVGMNGLWCTNISAGSNSLAFTVTSQIAAQPFPWGSPFRTSIRIVGVGTNTSCRILINNLPAVNLTNYPDGIIPIKVSTNGAVSLAFREVLVTPQLVSFPASGTSTCSVVLSDIPPPGGATVSMTRTGGDTSISTTPPASLLFTPANWNIPQTITFTSPRGTNWQNRSSTYLLQSPGYSNTTVTVTDVVHIPPRIDISNGSFEIVDQQYSTSIGGLYHPTGWSNLSGLDYQASSMLAGSEVTLASGATDNRILRLANDLFDPYYVGRIAQEIGPMIAGETYTFQADLLGGAGGGIDNLWGASAAFVNQIAVNPTVVYASQTVSSILSGQMLANGFNFSYTALPADNNKPLVILLQARPLTNAASSLRGGIDNARFSITPPASSITVLANPTNAGYASGSGSFTPGTAIEISATASNYWRFTGWNDGSTNNPRTVTVPATNTTYTASFSRIPPQPVIATFTGPGGGGVSIGGTTDIPGYVVTERTLALSPPIHWQPVQTNAVPGGAYSFLIPQGTSSAAFFRLRGS